MQTLARGGESVVVDLSETVFIDSAIIYTLIEADSNLASRGQGFALQVGAEPIVANLMKLSGVHHVAYANQPTRQVLLDLGLSSQGRTPDLIGGCSATPSRPGASTRERRDRTGLADTLDELVPA
jgi:hypothetical protein